MTATSPTPAVAHAAPAQRGTVLAERFDRAIVAVTVIPFVGYLILHVVGVPAALGALLLVLGGPHVLSTFGLYVEPGVARLARTDPLRFIWLPLAAIPLTALAFGVVRGPGLPWLLTAFLVWRTHHFTKQNLGMFAFWSRARRDAPMSPLERRLILATTAIEGLGCALIRWRTGSLWPAVALHWLEVVVWQTWLGGLGATPRA